MNIKFDTAGKEEIKRQDKLIHQQALQEREHGEKGYPMRNPFQRDYARILYSPAFRRLQGKMQILGVESSAFFRNRLTHSLEVAQIAKSIRIMLNNVIYGKSTKKSMDNLLSDLFVLEAAALAHDIGHPAFGHKGERVLNELLSPLDLHFEGNAQNYRVLRYLEKKDPESKGLNLSYRTLLAINKYIIRESMGMHKFMYNEDYDFLESFRSEHNLSNIRTIDAQIIEIADDIAYAVHDLEDGLSENYFTIDEILYEMNVEDDTTKGFSQEEISMAHKKMVFIVNKAKNKAMESKSYRNLQEFSHVFRKSLTTLLTDRFIKDVVLTTVSDKEANVHGTKEGVKELKLGQSYPLCRILSKKIFKCVTRRPVVALYEERGAHVIKTFFNLFTDSLVNKNGLLLPPDFRPILNGNEDEDDLKTKYARSASDYISGMMDTYAKVKYEEFFNVKFDEIQIKQI